ncbi:MAG: hypothetical protein QXV32_00060 [Conexivisphaerales archaeon]
MSNIDKGKRCSLIARMITWFDAEAELIPADIDLIEKHLKDYSGTDIYAIWKDVRDDFVAISTFPSRFQEISKYNKSLTRIRLFLLFGSIIAMVFTLLISFHALTLPVDPTYIIFVLFIVLYGVFAGNTFLNRSYNRKIEKLYIDHAEEFSGRKKHLRKAAQRLIDKLMIDIKSSKLDRQKYAFDVINPDYRNVEILRKRGGRYRAVVMLNQKEKEKEKE